MRSEDGLIAAFRQGLELAAIAVINAPAGIRIAASGGEIDLRAGETLVAQWWCRRGDEAARVAAEATLCLAEVGADPIAIASAAIARAAKLRHIALQSDEEMIAEAKLVIARVESELEALRQSGDLRSVNRSYRTYRLKATARGERIVPYARWLAKYKEGLVCRLAATLRFL